MATNLAAARRGRSLVAPPDDAARWGRTLPSEVYHVTLERYIKHIVELLDRQSCKVGAATLTVELDFDGGEVSVAVKPTGNSITIDLPLAGCKCGGASTDGV